MLITNCRIVTWGTPNQILEDHAVLVRGSKIERVGLQSDLVNIFSNEEKIDAKGQLLMPGLICAHTHFYGAFSRGLGIPGAAPADFPEILEKLWWPLDQSLSLDDSKYSALVCLIDSIEHGNTTLFDHHASPNAIEGSLSTIADAVNESGLRAVLCYEVTDRGGQEKAVAGIRENVRMIESVKKDNLNGRLNATFGLHASLTLSDQTLAQCRDAIDDAYGFHIHVAEHPVDEYDSLNKCGIRVIDRLKKFNMLGKNSIVAHGVHIDSKEAELLADSETWVTHQPRSNMNNAVGMADVESLLRLGIKVCMGNDGFSNAMWDEWRSCYLAHKLWHRDPQRMNGSKVIEMGAYNNAEMASHFFPWNGKVGMIEEGAQADLILVDYTPFTEMNTGNLPWQILFGFRDSMVTSTMVAGKFLMKDRQLLTLDKEEIFRKAYNLSKDVWLRYQKQFQH